MKKECIFIILLLFTFLLNAQNLIKGQIVDQYGNEFIACIKVNNKEINVDFETGKFKLETFEKNVEIIIELQFYLSIKYQLKLDNKLTDLGKIYLTSEMFWSDGPKKGIIKGEYKTGITK
jgi:hypothetical protein